jgi:hypothetical protein
MSTLGKFQRITTTDYNINQLQNNVAKVVDTLSVQPLTTGTLLKNVHLLSGDTTIFHGLNAPLQGYIITNIDGAATIYNAGSTTPDKTLVLNSTAAVIADIVVF